MPRHQHVQPHETRPSLDELFQVTKLLKDQFRVERIIAVAIVTVALVIMLGAGAMAAWKQDWAECKDILVGSGGVCGVGVLSLFFMYNRSLVFLERMSAARQEKVGHDE